MLYCARDKLSTSSPSVGLPSASSHCVSTEPFFARKNDPTFSLRLTSAPSLKTTRITLIFAEMGVNGAEDPDAPIATVSTNPNKLFIRVPPLTRTSSNRHRPCNSDPCPDNRTHPPPPCPGKQPGSESPLRNRDHVLAFCCMQQTNVKQTGR